MTDQDAWLDPLVAEIRAAGDASDELAAIFARLETELGKDEASRRWWAAFARTDATHT